MDTLNITLNCELAIRRLRLSDVTRTLWIDAICINQDNIQERNEQVQLMRSIYRGAYRVLVYLGEESTDSVNAMNFILDDHSRLGETCNRPPMGLGHGVLSSPQQVALDGLLERPWFERVWVLQEVWFAAEVEVLCGKHIVPWRALVYTSDYLNMNKKLHLTHAQIKPLPYVIQMQDKRISSRIGE
ncbi:hypothetical protein MMC14_000729 [Varicellaria rhodocarpa]|nr:hypothetical protein [Varicellaria rhodocarpa]